jgi:hypothetical protein
MRESPNIPTVVLVHGGFGDASFWGPVIKELQARDLPVLAPPNPLRGLARHTVDPDRESPIRMNRTPPLSAPHQRVRLNLVGRQDLAHRRARRPAARRPTANALRRMDSSRSSPRAAARPRAPARGAAARCMQRSHAPARRAAPASPPSRPSTLGLRQATLGAGPTTTGDAPDLLDRLIETGATWWDERRPIDDERSPLEPTFGRIAIRPADLLATRRSAAGSARRSASVDRRCGSIT